MCTDLDSEELSVLNGVDGITTRVLDVTNATAVNQLAVAMGRVDVLPISPDLCITEVFLILKKRIGIFHSI